MSNMKDMKSAPKNGTRILIQRWSRSWSREQNKFIRRGTEITECFWDAEDEKWRVWCGNYASQTTDWVDPIAWMKRPKTEIDSCPI